MPILYLFQKDEAWMPDRKKDKFVELAEKRTYRVLNNLELLGNLSNKRNYSYTEEQYQKIFRAIRKALKDSEDKFIENSKARSPVKFSLSE